MRALLLVLAALFSVPLAAVAAIFLVSFSFLFVIALTPPCFVPTTFHFTRMHWIAFRGEMGWDGDIENAVEHLLQCKSDTRDIVDRLLSDSNGTIVSLGMDRVVRESFLDGDKILTQFHHDTRWNHNLTHNDEYSRLLLAMWRMKKGIPLTPEDHEVIEDWPDPYFESLGVVPPERARSGT